MLPTGFLHLIETCIPCTPSLAAAFREAMTVLTFPRDYLLAEPPRKSDFYYYLAHGMGMGYSYPRGNVEVDDFYRAGDLILPGFGIPEAAHRYIRLLGPSDVWCLGVDQLADIGQVYPEARLLAQLFLQREVERLRKRVHDFKVLTGEDRYRILVESFPGLEGMVTHDQVASYLGLARGSLNRIKKRRRLREAGF